MRRYLGLVLALLALGLYQVSAYLSWGGSPRRGNESLGGRVVVSAPVQLLLYAGDRFLGANLEAMRIAVAGTETTVQDNAAYLIRAHRVVSQLNPCHEDNYYLGNALLTWGGAQAEGNEILQRATECRFWDEFPPFFHGLNLYFFQHDAQAARQALDVAAERATDNAATLRKLGIMITAGELRDDRAALAYLQSERDRAMDANLKEMLDKRIVRLEGLIRLRDAQAEYERRFQRPLPHPVDLLRTGILDAFPADPLRLGYEFVDGAFRLKEMKLQGLEPPQ